MKELICIVCPRGCHLRVDEANDYAVTGNSCPRGAAYGRAELTHPTRVLTSTVRIDGAQPEAAVVSLLAQLDAAHISLEGGGDHV